MITLRTIVSLLVAAGLGLGVTLSGNEQAKVRLQTKAEAAINTAGQVFADLQSEVANLTGQTDVGGQVSGEADLSAGAESSGSESGANANAEASVETRAEAGSGWDFQLPDLNGLNFNWDVFGSADGEASSH
ncbi:MAG TPA: hypothetical protein VGA52_00795 [Anaerolineales bacterium]|jgi:hypothetical protein